MGRKILTIGSAALFTAGMTVGIACAAEMAATKSSSMTSNMNVLTNLSDIKWGPQSNALPPGGNLAVLVGDPSKNGFVSLRLRLPAGYSVAPHSHPTDLHVTVLSGTVAFGIGDKIDSKTAAIVSRGGYFVEPAQMHHFVVAKAASIIQIDLDGPFAITYVNPADDPRNKKTEK